MPCGSILICQRTIGRYGNLTGARSIPEYLGERYQSEALRLSAAIFSLILLFYLAGQLVAGLVMFEMMLGLPRTWALVITTAILLGYVTLGGAHADILTDGVQGFLMVGDSRLRVFLVQVPIAHPVQALRKDLWIARPVGQFQRIAKTVIGVAVVARGPQPSDVYQRAPL